MLKKYLSLTVFLLLIGMFWSVLFSPSLTWAFVIPMFIFSLILSISSILKKHKGSENQRQKITRDVLILITMFIVVFLIGGWAGLWVGKQAEGRFGAAVAVISALAVSFAVGYLIRKAMRKLLA